MKFGGTSVEGATAFKNAAHIVFDRRASQPVVVVSAMAGFTDALLGSVQQALTAGAENGASSLEKHFDRHLRVIEALLRAEAPRVRALVDQSRVEIASLLKAAAAELGDTEAGNDRTRRRFLKTRLFLMVKGYRRRCSPRYL